MKANDANSKQNNHVMKEVSNTILIADEIKPAPQSTIIDCDAMQMQAEINLGRVM